MHLETDIKQRYNKKPLTHFSTIMGSSHEKGSLRFFNEKKKTINQVFFLFCKEFIINLILWKNLPQKRYMLYVEVGILPHNENSTISQLQVQ